MKFRAWAASWWRLLAGRCPECEARLCPAWGALGNAVRPSAATYLMHRGIRVRNAA